MESMLSFVLNIMHELQITNCIYGITTDIDIDETKLVFTNPDTVPVMLAQLMLTHSITISDTGLQFATSDAIPRPNLVVIINDNTTQLREYFDEIDHDPYTNLSALHLIYHYGAAEEVGELFAITWKLYIIRTVIVDVDGNVFAARQFQKHCGNDIEKEFMFNCAARNVTKLSELYEQKLLRYGGCPLRAIALEAPPYVIDVHSKDNPGLEANFIRIYAQKHNFTLKFVEHDYKSWGRKHKNGTYSNMLGELYNGRADVLFGRLRFQADVDADFSTTDYFMPGALSLFIPASHKVPNWIRVVRVFEPTVWIHVCGAFVLYTLTTHLVSLLARHSEDYNNYIVLLLRFYGTILNYPIKLPKKALMRLMYTFWLFFAFVVANVYSGTLISFLVNPIYYEHFRDLQDVKNSKIAIGGNINSREVFKEDPDIYHNWVMCNINEECINRTAFQRDMVTVENDLLANYFIDLYYLDENKRPLIYNMKTIVNYFTFILIRKGFPIRLTLNEQIENLAEAGIFAMWRHPYIKDRIDENEEEYVELKIGHFLFVFYLHAISSILGIIILLIELGLQWIKKRNRVYPFLL